MQKKRGGVTPLQMRQVCPLRQGGLILLKVWVSHILNDDVSIAPPHLSTTNCSETHQLYKM